MYKILIVEDELFVRMGLKMSINWQEYGFEISGEVSNGQQALEFIKKNHPDIVLTDIKMPIMDGITLIKEISKNFPSVKCIVLSNYDEFDLVKEALKSGADNYFLKVTINPEELIKALQEVCVKIEAERSSYNEKTNLRLDDSALINKGKFIHNLIKGKMSNDNINSEIKKYNLNINLERGFLLYITIENYISLVEQRYQGNENLFAITLMSVLTEVLNQKYVGEVFEYRKVAFIVIASGRGDEILINSSSLALAQQIRSAVYRFLNISTRIVYDLFYDSIESLSNIILSINELETIGFYECEDSLISFNTHKPFFKDLNKLYKLRDQFKTSIEYQNNENSLSIIEEFFSLSKEKRIDPLDVKGILISIIGFLEEELSKKNIEAVPSINSLQMAGSLRHYYSINDVEQFFYNHVLDLVESITQVNEDEARSEIMKAMEYIQNNFSDKLTLEDIAKYVSMNKSYFSRFFKKETGINVQDYIIKIRMEKAAEMLRDRNAKIADIASAVGYSDIFYFDRSFKKYFNVSPSQYRRNLYSK